MAWIYLAESQDSLKPLMGTFNRSPTVKTTDTLKLSFCRVCGIEAFHVPLSGMTCGHSVRDIFPFFPISFTEDFLVKTSPTQDFEKAWAASVAAFFQRSLGSQAKYDPASFSWRTSQRLLFEEQSELLANFAAYGMTVDGEFYPLLTWVRTTGENGGGFLPTPAANPYGTNQGGSAGRKGKVRPSLDTWDWKMQSRCFRRLERPSEIPTSKRATSRGSR